MISRILFCLLFLFPFLSAQAQEAGNIHEGTVSYLSSRNIYVKFHETGMIETGDTLFIQREGTLVPALVVTNKSSISCVCDPIEGINLEKGAKVFFQSSQEKKPELPFFESPAPVERPPEEPVSSPQPVARDLTNEQKENKEAEERKTKTRGRLSAASYNSFSPGSGDAGSHRMQYRLSFNSVNMAHSRFSSEAYVTYRHNMNAFSPADQKEPFEGDLRVYNLAIKYDLTENSHVWAGRKINPNISNLGAIDGLQFEQRVRNFRFGAVAGFRPDFRDFGLNTRLLEYGAVIAHATAPGKNFVQSSLALFNQMNGNKTDRRFAYFQHSNTLFKKLNTFCSFEFDLFERVNEQDRSTFRLTNLFVTTRYRVNRDLNFSVAYDNRKNVIFYETDRSYLDRLLDDETRQGLRFQARYRLIKFLTAGASYSYRFQKNSDNQSSNLMGYLTWSRIPGIKAAATLNANRIETSYLKGNILSFRFSKDLVKGKLSSDWYFRLVDYQYLNFESSLGQKIAGLNLNYRINRRLSFFIFGEATLQDTRNYLRINTRIIQRL